MRLFALLPALLAATLAESRTVSIFIQPITAPETTPSLLAEVRYEAVEASSPSSASEPTTPPTTTIASEVSSYEAPDLPEGAKLLRIGAYDEATGTWVSSTSVLSVDNFGKGYSPHFVLSVDGGDDEGNVDAGRVVGVACRGVRIDAGQTRDFGPQAVVVLTGKGKQPDLNKPVVLSPEGRKVEVQEKTFLQKYWWALAIGVFFLATSGGDGNVSFMSPHNQAANQMTAPARISAPLQIKHNGTTTSAQDANAFANSGKGKGKAAGTEQEPVDDTSMAEDTEEDEDEEPGEEAEDNMEEIDLDNVIGRRTRGKKIDFAKAAQENPADDDEDDDDDDDFEGEAEPEEEADDDKMDED
ncbi:histone chaperone domain CHZ-domain-containing protein [Cercophora scortea]|uniref:Histone chaperone domain CHZ-domain-containing protein n=1 Tax=Cercophora scortea TaxID=314031 RepID=A0AAE0M7T6_9PEZI|nr:histone chaperone domain CHZ-domain-containing protein [Cercophora scortea]